MVSKDPKWFRESDLSEARQVNQDIVKILASQSRDMTWSERRSRLWTLMRASYDEVCAAATFLFRKEPANLAHFVSLFAARQTRRKKKNDGSEAASHEAMTP